MVKITTGFSKEGKTLIDTTQEDYDDIKEQLSPGDRARFEANVINEAIKFEKQVNMMVMQISCK